MITLGKSNQNDDWQDFAILISQVLKSFIVLHRLALSYRTNTVETVVKLVLQNTYRILASSKGWIKLSRKRPSGHFPSDRLKPSGSLVHGMPAETIARATKSFRAWCLAGLHGDFLQTKPCSPCASTRAPQWHLCGTQRVKPSRRPTPILTASLSSLYPYDDIGIAWSQSPLCGDEAAKKTSCAGVLKLDFTWATYTKGCFGSKSSRRVPIHVI